MEINNIKEKFYEKYGNRNNQPVLFFSPGRVNLIGEHTDYNAGYVFPCALNYGTYLAIRTTGEKWLKFSTLNFDEDQETELKNLFIALDKSWINYPLGVINEFLKKTLRFQALSCFFMAMYQTGQAFLLRHQLKW